VHPLDVDRNRAVGEVRLISGEDLDVEDGVHNYTLEEVGRESSKN
jgi:hypothetical protein